MNAKKELLEHIRCRSVKYIDILYGCPYSSEGQARFSGTLDDVIESLNFKYDDGYGSQELFGLIWYDDGTWSERCEYDGSEWWEWRTCPPIPEDAMNYNI